MKSEFLDFMRFLGLVQVTGLEPVIYTRKTRINSIYFETCVAFCVAFCFYP